LPTTVTERLSQATPEQLELWAERVLDARFVRKLNAINNISSTAATEGRTERRGALNPEKSSDDPNPTWAFAVAGCLVVGYYVAHK